MRPKKKRRGKKNRPVFKPGCEVAQRQIEALREEAQKHGLEVRVNTVECSGRRKTLHVMFDDALGRVLNWWPGSGSIYSPVDGRQGKVGDAWLVLDIALSLRQEILTPEEEHLAAIMRRVE